MAVGGADHDRDRGFAAQASFELELTTGALHYATIFDRDRSAAVIIMGMDPQWMSLSEAKCGIRKCRFLNSAF